jgi:hypothetical protein
MLLMSIMKCSVKQSWIILVIRMLFNILHICTVYIYYVLLVFCVLCDCLWRAVSVVVMEIAQNNKNIFVQQNCQCLVSPHSFSGYIPRLLCESPRHVTSRVDSAVQLLVLWNNSVNMSVLPCARYVVDMSREFLFIRTTQRNTKYLFLYCYL